VEAIELIGARHPGEVVAAVTHAVMIRLLVVGLTGLTGESWRITVGRGSLTTVIFKNGEISLGGLPEGTDVD
jgi:broad specificity phosphatase PhoE